MSDSDLLLALAQQGDPTQGTSLDTQSIRRIETLRLLSERKPVLLALAGCQQEAADATDEDQQPQSLRDKLPALPNRPAEQQSATILCPERHLLSQ